MIRQVLGNAGNRKSEVLGLELSGKACQACSITSEAARRELLWGNQIGFRVLGQN